ncbi:MAG: hypothetical protein D6767_06425, partial [Candidatus Hydrogenedentota bacterium]
MESKNKIHHLRSKERKKLVRKLEKEKENLQIKLNQLEQEAEKLNQVMKKISAQEYTKWEEIAREKEN